MRVTDAPPFAAALMRRLGVPRDAGPAEGRLYASGMDEERLKMLPGAEIVLPGLADLAAGRGSVNAGAVQAAAPRLRQAGLDAPGRTDGVVAAHDLYRRLGEELGDGGHSRYNATLARVAGFARAAEDARRG